MTATLGTVRRFPPLKSAGGVTYIYDATLTFDPENGSQGYEHISDTLISVSPPVYHQVAGLIAETKSYPSRFRPGN